MVKLAHCSQNTHWQNTFLSRQQLAGEDAMEGGEGESQVRILVSPFASLLPEGKGKKLAYFYPIWRSPHHRRRHPYPPFTDFVEMSTHGNGELLGCSVVALICSCSSKLDFLRGNFLRLIRRRQ